MNKLTEDIHDFRLHITGTAEVDGTPITDGTVRAREIELIVTDGPMEVNVESVRLQRESTNLGPVESRQFPELLSLLGEDCSNTEVLDYIALRVAGFSPSEWAGTKTRNGATAQTIRSNARAAERHLERKIDDVESSEVTNTDD